MGNYFRKETGKLQPKLIKSVLVIVIIAFLVVSVGVIFYFSSNYRNQEIRNQENQLDKNVAQIAFWQKTVSNISKQIATDWDLQNGIYAKEEVSAAYSLTKRNVHLRLLTYSHILDFCQEITIYTIDGKTFSSAEMRGSFYPDASDWYQEFKNSGEQSGYTKVHLSTSNQYNSVKDVISYILTYYSANNTRRQMGDIIISLDYSALEDISKMDLSMLNGYCLYDGHGVPILKQGNVNLSYKSIAAHNRQGIIKEANGDILIVSADMNDNWLMVTEINRDQLQKRTWMIGIFLACIFAVIAIVLWLVIAFYIRRVVNPINQLSKAAVEVGNGNFNVNVDIRTDDELEVLADVFNTMVLDIKKLMEESVEHEKITRKMQIDQLMLQINPHFIYNTLNSIVYMARMNGNKDIADFVNAFISLLQSTLRIKDSIFISLREELSNVENYLLLQKYQYADKFDVEICCDEELKECAIPKVMLQPIVENAIFHGIAPKEEKGHLKITASKTGETLEICVEDDGVGMTPETARQMLKEEKVNRSGMRKIGIANVSNRISQIYGEPYSMEIESNLNIGTKVIMKIPYQRYQEADKVK